MNNDYLNNSMNAQRLNELAKKYKLVNYMPGQSFDSVKDSMSAEDYETSQKLLNYYTNQQTLTNDFNYNNQNIEKNRKQQLQENAISKEMTMKYLPDYLKLQGMGGLGVSESAVISANNDFRNARSTINADAELQKADLLKNYQENIVNLDAGATSETDTIRNKYEQIRSDLANDESVVIESRFQNLIGSDGKISEEDYQQLETYINGLKESVGNENVQKLQVQLKQYSPYVRTQAEQDVHNKNMILEQYRSGVGKNDGIRISSRFGGGFTLSDNMKIKIKDDGISLQDFIDRSKKSGKDGLNYWEAGAWGSEKDKSKAIAEAARKGDLANGTIVDTNNGKGQKMWIYLNGRFYRIEVTQ